MAHPVRRKSEPFLGQTQEFCQSLVHDLKIPITQISLSVQLLENQAAIHDPAGTCRQLLARIEGACTRLVGQIDSIKSVFQSEPSLQTVPVDLSSLAEEIADDLRTCGRGDAVRFYIQKGLTAPGDPRLLRLLLLNLLENACKYTEGKDRPRVEFGGVTDPDFGRLFFVRDNGRGIGLTETEDLFRPFSRVHRDPKIPGTGMGLFLVRRIVELHGGRIWGGGNDGAGAQFFFTLA